MRAFRLLVGLGAMLVGGVSGLIAQTNVKSGFGSIAGANIRHPVNNNIYDQVLMTGPVVTVAADPGEVVRVSLMDDNDDIIQVEFAGTGTVTIELDRATYVPPAPPLKYDQPGVAYVKGHASVTVNNSGADTFLSVFSVGRGNAVNQTLFRAGMSYDAMADVQRVQLNGSEMGAVLTGNARFTGNSGVTGIQAPHTSVRYRVIVGDVDAREGATPALRLGEGSTLEWDNGALLIAGGRLQQSNNLPVDASTGSGSAWPKVTAVGGTLSSGEAVPAATINSQFVSKAPGSVSVNGVARSTRGFVPATFDDLLGETGFEALDFGDGTSVQFSGGDNGTYALNMNTVLDGELVSGRITGSYSYAVSGANQNRMTFSITLDAISLRVGSSAFNGTIYSLAQQAGEPLPVRITASAEFLSPTEGTFTMSVRLTNGLEQSHSGAFDEDNGLDFGFL